MGNSADPVHYRLFVSGYTARSETAVRNARRVLTECHGDEFDLEVIDALEDPDAAMRARVVATPLLIRDSPPPRRMLVGDLSNFELAIESLAGE